MEGYSAAMAQGPLHGLPSLAGAVILRPWLWSAAVRALLGMAPQGWWATGSHLPLPAPGYMRFRSQTAYGGEGDRPMTKEDFVTWLEWTRSVRSLLR